MSMWAFAMWCLTSSSFKGNFSMKLIYLVDSIDNCLTVSRTSCSCFGNICINIDAKACSLSVASRSIDRTTMTKSESSARALALLIPSFSTSLIMALTPSLLKSESFLITMVSPQASHISELAVEATNINTNFNDIPGCPSSLLTIAASCPRFGSRGAFASVRSAKKCYPDAIPDQLTS
jgi:hypothetical protein